jgi:DNA repair protein RadA/Sms
MPTKFFCQQCGAEAGQWHGKCSACGEWNSLVEMVVRAPSGRRHAAARRQGGAIAAAGPVPAAGQVRELAPAARRATGLSELDRVLGGGVVPGALVLLAGDPGIGKSTLLLQCANSFAQGHGQCLYVTGEESLAQVGLRARRVEPVSPDLLVLAETDVEAIVGEVERMAPGLLVVDSIQALYAPDIESLPGSVSQVRDCATRLLRAAKDLGVAVFLVGHVTKEGAVAGPRLLEHMVDTVLSLEGDRHSGYRILRSTKNRFGSIDELGLFQMTERGMEGVPDASAALLAERRAGVPGSSVVAALEGSRPLLVEIQALVSGASPYASPRRSVTGVDYNRTCLMLAVLEKRAGLSLASADVFVNVPGGVRVTEPAADLGLALAVASSLKDQAIRPDTACLGEVGLTGEIRAVPRLERRLSELARRGFRRCLVPQAEGRQVAGTDGPTSAESRAGLEVVPVEHLHDAFRAAFL